MEVVISFLIKMIIWSIATYWVVNKINKDENSEFKANPWAYILITVLFGYICSMAFFIGNKFKFENKKNAYIISYMVGFVMLAINFLILFA